MHASYCLRFVLAGGTNAANSQSEKCGTLSLYAQLLDKQTWLALIVQATSFENYVPDTGHPCGDVARDGLYLAKPSGRLSPVHGMLRTAIIFYNP